MKRRDELLTALAKAEQMIADARESLEKCQGDVRIGFMPNMAIGDPIKRAMLNFKCNKRQSAIIERFSDR